MFNNERLMTKRSSWFKHLFGQEAIKFIRKLCFNNEWLCTGAGEMPLARAPPLRSPPGNRWSWIWFVMNVPLLWAQAIPISVQVLIDFFWRNKIRYKNALLPLVWPICVVILSPESIYLMLFDTQKPLNNPFVLTQTQSIHCCCPHTLNQCPNANI